LAAPTDSTRRFPSSKMFFYDSTRSTAVLEYSSTVPLHNSPWSSPKISVFENSGGHI
jgi:hypothetical protein